ncbi:MAG: hypothetical protein WAM90_02465, partial [Rhodanobacter sp.]
FAVIASAAYAKPCINPPALQQVGGDEIKEVVLKWIHEVQPPPPLPMPPEVYPLPKYSHVAKPLDASRMKRMKGVLDIEIKAGYSPFRVT